MKFNLKDRPVKSTPQAYEKFLKGLEKELRAKLRILATGRSLSGEVQIWRNAWKDLVKEILGVSDGEPSAKTETK